jgi:hypothetical protein
MCYSLVGNLAAVALNGQVATAAACTRMYSLIVSSNILLMQCALLYELLFFQEVPDDHSQLWRMLFQKSLEAASTQDGLDGSTDTDTDSSEADTN